MTNKEWLFSLPLDELYAWFDAEHGEGYVNESLLRTVDELTEELERYRELLGRAVDNAHATVTLVDLDGEVVA